jgi:arsenate reductase
MPNNSNQYDITLFGIPNCDTVKKARTWLEANNIHFHFHNFKKDGLTADVIKTWLMYADLNQIINRKGTTWRALNDEQKQAAEQLDSALELMIAYPSIIKRPVLHVSSKTTQTINVGFNEQAYRSLFTELN